MNHDFKFIAFFVLCAVFAIVLMGVSDVLGILLTGSLGGLLVALSTGRRKVRKRGYPKRWPSLFLCASISAAIFACLLTAKFYIWTLVTSITGSPYDLPYDVSYLRVFTLSSLLLFASLAVTLVVHDFWEFFGLEQPE
ncbi:hypothetical protein QN096_22285 [Metapseudomonas otitidis]|uniref:hypothetical protein n=1 Tax=Metapseudomonas otitidis TaxID=319939 RepID=UPI00253F697D|nr:hypothetical protein [Pseudomonas otitidis]WIF66465.1 hypothetical protein QN096_22285 [Pseudomonas otitidis]